MSIPSFGNPCNSLECRDLAPDLVDDAVDLGSTAVIATGHQDKTAIWQHNIFAMTVAAGGYHAEGARMRGVV